MPAAKLREPERSPERQRLADAIDRRTACADLLSRINTAQPAGWDRVAKAEARLKRAEDALRHARAAEPARLVASLIGETPTNTSLAETEAAAKAAQAELDQARTISRALGEREQTTQDDLFAAGDAVKRAIPPVIRSELAAFGGRAARARDLLLVASEMSRALPPGSMPVDWDLHPTPNGHSTTYRDWRGVVDALKNDPDVELPLGELEPDAGAGDAIEAAPGRAA